MLPGVELATAMVLELCGGTPSEVTVAGTPEIPARPIYFPLGELPRLTGLQVDRREIERVLGRLGFAFSDAGKHLKVTAPSWRADVEGKADLVEEIVRILGVDRVPATPFDRGEAPRKPVLTPIQLRTRKAKRALAARGMITVAAVGTNLFLGGWLSPVPFLPDSPLWFFAKFGLMLFFFIWLRGTLPRFRYDQLMDFGWKVLIPVAVANILVTAAVVALRH